MHAIPTVQVENERVIVTKRVFASDADLTMAMDGDAVLWVALSKRYVQA